LSKITLFPRFCITRLQLYSENRIFWTMISKKSMILVSIVALLLGLNGYLLLKIYMPGDQKAVLSPADSPQQEAPVEPCKDLSGMVWIPGGTFTMGSPKGVGNTNEYPRHTVTVNGFYIDTTEVTQEKYSRVMGENPSLTKDCADCPVENVTWHDAMAYCRKTGKRLPTEAEWEYACRAGSAADNYWGRDSSEKYAWFRENAQDKIHPVGLKIPNNFGLHDMIGNVWEWCGDWFDSTYYEKSPLKNPHGPDTGMHRVLRGGGWLNNLSTLRSALRDGAVPEDQSDLFGFRCVCSQ
jgi:formylglycine-generating enzyme required for sulfatase activity